MLLKALWLTDSFIALVTVACFFIYLFGRQMNAAINVSWIILLGILGLNLLLCVWLEALGFTLPVIVLLALLAAPGIIYILLQVSARAARLKSLRLIKRPAARYITMRKS